MQSTIQRGQLFWASCLALLVTSLSFGIRAGMINTVGAEFGLTQDQIGEITATAFWGFPLAVVIGGMIVDIIGMKRLLVLAFLFHLAGIVMTIFAKGYWPLFFSTLLIGIANGTVEAACNPLVTALYPDNKTTKLNHFHLWFPGGIVLGTLIVFFFKEVNINWQWQVAVMLIPTLFYGFLFSRLKFPVTERVAAGVSTGDMYKAVGNPLFIFMFICMFGTAITELFTNQYAPALLEKVTKNSILILCVTTGVMTLGRAFAEPIVHRLSPVGVLLISAILATLGLYLLAHSEGNMLFVASIVFGMGVTFFWPTMLGFVAENLPKTGALGLNLMGGAGMFAVSIYTAIMGGYFNKLIATKLPAGADVKEFAKAVQETPNSDMAKAYSQAQFEVSPQMLEITNFIPVVLIVAFTGLYFYMRGRKKPQQLSVAGA